MQDIVTSFATSQSKYCWRVSFENHQRLKTQEMHQSIDRKEKG